jgi:Protein of unknown function (DUF2938)
VSEHTNLMMRAVLIGAGATAVMDIWAVIQKRLLGVPLLNFAMVGRWIGHLPRGQFTHNKIIEAPPIAGELAIGWSAHYIIGIVFAAALLSICGLEWASQPTLLPALIVGVVTVAAPFFIMQPGMGAGIAASKTPQPNIARLRSLIAHTSFGVGLYLAALMFAFLLQ